MTALADCGNIYVYMCVCGEREKPGRWLIRVTTDLVNN